MFSYENGLVLALILWVFGFIKAIYLSNSRTQKNLKKIGKRLSVNLGLIVDYDYSNESIFWKILKFTLFNVVISIPFILLSWIYVAYFIGINVYFIYKDFGAPQSVKEFRWRMKNTDLTLDQMVRELMKANDNPSDDFDKLKNDILQEIEYKKESARK